MIIPILEIGVIGLVLGLLIGAASKFFEVKANPMVQQVYDVLPHINCGACGTPGCMAMAEAIVDEDYPVEKCKPGSAAMKKNVEQMMKDYKAGVLTFEESH